MRHEEPAELSTESIAREIHYLESDQSMRYDRQVADRIHALKQEWDRRDTPPIQKDIAA